MDKQIILPLLLSTLAGLSTILGSLLSFISFKDREGVISFSLSFSLSVMICISLFDLIPESIKVLNKSLSFFECILIIFGTILIVKWIFNLFKKKSPLLAQNSLYRLGVMSMITLMLHNFPEGIITFMSSYNNINTGINLTIAIMLHNIPEGISISIPTYYSTGSRKRGVLYSLIAGLSEPIGAIIAYIILHRFISEITLSIALLIVGAIMINLSIEEIYPESIKYKKYNYNKLGLILGLILVIINLIVL